MSEFFSGLLFYLVIKPVSLLPFSVLYIFSDILFFLSWNILPYRKKIVINNLKHSFPGKSEEDIQFIAKQFYHHFFDLIFESVKLFSANSEEILKRFVIINPEFMRSYFRNNKSLIIVSSHYANWEWAGLTLPTHSNHKAAGIYQKLSNKFFDRKLLQTRAKLNLKLISRTEAPRFIASHKNELYTYGFISDQSPPNPLAGHWLQFLNQDTLFLTGAEKIAARYNFPVVYAVILKSSRGHYTIEYIPVSDSPAEEPAFLITEKFARITETIILKKPEFWLWTHRRWKHKRTDTPVNLAGQQDGKSNS